MNVQALLVHDLDHGADSLAAQLGLGHGRHGAIAEEERTIVVAGELGGFLDGEGAHADGDIDARRAINGQRDGHGRRYSRYPREASRK